MSNQPTPDQIVKAKLYTAMALIREGNKDAARSVLLTIPNDANAQRLLTQLGDAPEPKAERSGNPLIWILATGILAILGVGIAGLGGYRYGVSMQPTIAPTTTALIEPSPVATNTPKPTSTRRPTSMPTRTPIISVGIRDNPVKIGDPFYLEQEVEGSLKKEFSVTVSRVLRGDEAWKQIVAANSFNNPPRNGMEYVMILLSIEYNAGEGALSVSPYNFKVVSNGQALDEYSSIVEPDPAFSAELFSGGKGGGWLVREVYKDDLDPVLWFGFDIAGRGGFFFSLTQ